MSSQHGSSARDSPPARRARPCAARAPRMARRARAAGLRAARCPQARRCRQLRTRPCPRARGRAACGACPGCRRALGAPRPRRHLTPRPVSTEGGTRRVRLVREGGGGYADPPSRPPRATAQRTPTPPRRAGPGARQIAPAPAPARSPKAQQPAPSVRRGCQPAARRRARAARPVLQHGSVQRRTHRVRLVRGEGHGVSTSYGKRDTVCPDS